MTPHITTTALRALTLAGALCAGCFPLVSFEGQYGFDQAITGRSALTIPVPIDRRPYGDRVRFVEVSGRMTRGNSDNRTDADAYIDWLEEVSVGAGFSMRRRKRWLCLSYGLTHMTAHFGDDVSPGGPAEAMDEERRLGTYVTLRNFGYEWGGPFVRLSWAPRIEVDGLESRIGGLTLGYQWGVEPIRWLEENFPTGHKLRSLPSGVYYVLGMVLVGVAGMGWEL